MILEMVAIDRFVACAISYIVMFFEIPYFYPFPFDAPPAARAVKSC